MSKKILSGVKVRHPGTNEVGIVVHTWYKPTIDETDCYIAFFGQSFPEGKPTEKPYVLRYAATSLEAVDV